MKSKSKNNDSDIWKKIITIQQKMLKEDLRQKERIKRKLKKMGWEPDKESNEPIIAPLSQVENKHIKEVCQYCEYNMTEASEYLGISRVSLWRRIKNEIPELNIMKKDYEKLKNNNA